MLRRQRERIVVDRQDLRSYGGDLLWRDDRRPDQELRGIDTGTRSAARSGPSMQLQREEACVRTPDRSKGNFSASVILKSSGTEDMALPLADRWPPKVAGPAAG